MTNVILQGASRAAPFLARTAGRVALAYGQAAISRAFDTRIFEGPRLEGFHLLTSRDGAPMARVFGKVRLAGQVIWASHIKETVSEDRISGKGGGPRQREYSYTISFAIGLCEGEIAGIGRIYANGAQLQTEGVNYRVYHGTEAQNTDPLMVEIEGENVPAFRGTAYIVFEDFPLDDYGARLPQINVEVFRQPARMDDRPRLEELVRGIDLIPGSGEAAYAPGLVEERLGEGITRPLNRNNLTGQTDVMAAIEQLETQLPNCKSVNIVVSWFGDDLRCASCQIRPGVETRDRILEPTAWRVCGQDRNAALLLRQIDGHSVYGGTPPDADVIALIRMLKARGFTVGLYPFILMDVDEHTGQGEFPWRGRISVDLATAQDSVAASAEVDAFFGACQPADFGTHGDAVTYSGPAEHSFRRHILHYAKLAQIAGGVDHMLIGSEMRGLTTVRGPGLSYPAVTQFAQLASDVRSIVGASVKLSYAADWSEYFGHHFGDNVIFHLDPLWGHPAIDAVAIDAYFPLSDQRDGDDPAYDVDTLQANIEGGEGYEWYYASAADRDEQIRTPITDGAENKPWVYRYKDLKNWWAIPHHNRIYGIEQATPTDWVPESKPFWLTEIGCPAIDKGANQPNVFYDPKSSESAAPYFSTGERDDVIQRRYLEAMLTYYDPAGVNNPVSSVYGAPMIDPDQTHVWCWDGRPYPDFPARSTVWADGENWQRGHWLSGRVGAALLPDVVNEIVTASGLPFPDNAQLNGLVEGYVIDRPMSARAALAPLAKAYDFTLVEGADGLRFVHNGAAEVTALSLQDLAQGNQGSIIVSEQSAAQKLRDVCVHYLDAGRDYALGSARGSSRAGTDIAQTENVADIELPLVLDAARGKQIAERMLKAGQFARQEVNFTLMPERLALDPADVITLPDIDGRWQISSMDGRDVRRVNAVKIGETAAPMVGGALPVVTADPVTTSAPLVKFFDLPTLENIERSGPLIGAFSAPFNPIKVEFGGEDITLTQAMTFGKLSSPLARGSIAIADQVNSFEVTLAHGQLAAIGDDALLSGGNLCAVRTQSGWEILQFGNAELIAEKTYRLSRLIRGLGGSDSVMEDIVPNGAEFVLLNAALKPLRISPEYAGNELTLTVFPTGRPQTSAGPFTYAAQHLRPLAPVHIRARHDDTDLHLSWVRRTRISGDGWQGTDVPMAEAQERYGVELLSGGEVVWSGEVGEPSLSIPKTDILPMADLARISQLSETIGLGHFAGVSVVI